MNWLDIVIAIAILVCASIGWKVGLVRTVVVLGGTALGLFFAGQYYGDLGVPLESFIPSANGARVAAFLVIFLAVVLVAVVVGMGLRALLGLVRLGWLDRIGGFVLGAAAGAALSAGLCVGLRTFPVLGLDQAVEGSLLGSFLVENFPAVLALLPSEFDVPGLPR